MVNDDSKAFKDFSALIKEIDRIAIFIDGHATQNAARTLSLRIDWMRLRSFFLDLARVRKLGFYLGVKEPLNNIEDNNPAPWWKSVVDWMSYNGFYTKTARAYDCVMSDDNKSSIKTTIDLNICIDAMAIADEVDHVILFTGNSDFIPLVEALQAKGKVVIIVSNSAQSVEQVREKDRDKDKEFHLYQASKGLLKAANLFIELDSMREEIEKPNNGKS